MKDLSDLLGLGVPFIVAGAVYWLFSFLDKKASEAANRVVADWLKGRAFKREELGHALLLAFDHLYRAPLLTLRSFLRSAEISIGVTLMWWLAVALYEHLPLRQADIALTTVLTIGPIIVGTDYASLFVIRKCLTMTAINLNISLLLAFAFGIIAVGIVLIAVTALANVIVGSMFGETAAQSLVSFITSGMWGSIVGAAEDTSALAIVAPSVLVHFWLPLFLMGALLAKGYDAFLRGVGLTTWFIRRGEEHPFDAIGLAATVIVFVAGSAVQVIIHVL